VRDAPDGLTPLCIQDYTYVQLSYNSMMTYWLHMVQEAVQCRLTLYLLQCSPFIQVPAVSMLPKKWVAELFSGMLSAESEIERNPNIQFIFLNYIE
jgi:hypothetical protein